MIASEIPDDPDRPEMVGLSKMQNLLDDFRWCSVGGVLGDWLLVDQPCFAILLIERLPSVKAGPCNAKVPARLGSVTVSSACLRMRNLR